MVTLSSGNLNQSFKNRVPAGYNAKLLFSILAFQAYHRIKLPILQEGEGLCLPHNHRRKVGANGLVKVDFQLTLLRLRQSLEVNDVDTNRLQLSHQLLVDFFSFLLQALHLF